MKKCTLFGAALAILAFLIPAQAAHVSVYGAAKKQIFQQTSDSAVDPATGDAYGFSAFAVPTSEDSILLAMLMPPAASIPAFLMESSMGFELESTFATQADLNRAFGDGDYTFTIMSEDFMAPSDPAIINLGAGTYPNTPRLSNYADMQSVDPSDSLVISWNAFDMPTADSFVQLTVRDGSDILFQTGWPGQGTALAATARSVTIPADTLYSGERHEAALVFGRITNRNTTAIPGATGFAILATETRFDINTGGSDTDPGDDPDDTPPVLMSSLPFSGAQNVSVNSTIRFTFSTPMASQQSITWSGNVAPASFTYSWSGDGRTLTCTYNGSFPTGATITWMLDPEIFESASGVSLLPFNNSGSFSTGSGQSSGGGDPCDPDPSDDHLGSFSLFKSLNYVQSHPHGPVLNPESGAMFTAMVASPATNPVTQATLRLPNGATKTLTSFFGPFMAFEEFPSQEALDAAYPAGDYTLTVTRASGTGTLTLNLGASGFPPTPQVTNLGTPFDPAADSAVHWLPFTDAGAKDSLSFDLHQGATSFHAPDLCIPRPLANTDISIVVPKNTFTAGFGIEGSLSFMKWTAMDTNTIPDIMAFAGYIKTTEFSLQTSGSTPIGQPKIQNLLRHQNGSVNFQVVAQAGATLTIEGTTDLKNWTHVAAGAAVSGMLEVSDPDAASMPRRFYRVKAF